jgi:hypothetical protein
MFGKVFIRFIFILLVIGLVMGGVNSSQAIDLTKKADSNIGSLAEQNSSLLYLPITLNGKGTAALKDTVFGLEMRRISGQENLNAVTAADTAWIRRNGLLWSKVESVEGVYRWDQQESLEQELMTAHQNGLRVILVVRATPEWAQKYKGVSCGPIREDKLAAFGDFLYQAVKRYSQPPYNVKYWEIWNEPDIDYNLVINGRLESGSQYGCWGETDDPYAGGGDYSDVLKVAYPRIKAADSEAQVVVGGMLLRCYPETCSFDDAHYFEGILHHHGANDGDKYFDIVSFHAYEYYFGRLGKYGNTWWRSGWNSTLTLVKKAEFLRSVMAQYNVDKPIMVTETALLCGSDGTEPICLHPDFENTKAAYIAQSYAAALASGIKANIWYSLTGNWRGNNLLDSELKPLPSYYAYTNVVKSLSNVSFTRVLSEYPDVNGYVFESDDKIIWFAWSRVTDKDLNVSPVQMDLPATPLKIWDVFGEKVAVDGSSIIVTGMPLYIQLAK